MIAKMSILPVALLSLVACGGDDKPTVTVKVDAKVFQDAPPPPPCGVDAAGFGTLSLGSTAMPVTGDWIDLPADNMTGPYMGKTTFVLAGNLPGSTMTLRDPLIIIVPKGNAGFPTGAVTLDPDPNSTTPAAYGYILGDFDTGTNEFVNLYWPSTGSITITAISEADGGAITGSVSAINFREVDDSGDVAGGCTTKIGGLNFTLKQMNMAATGKEVVDPSTLTPAQRLAVAKAAAKRLGNNWL